MKIPFNKPLITGNELSYIAEAHKLAHLSGDGTFSKKCHQWLEKETGARKALLTHSCTAALEMAAMLAGIQPGDEVIMPSYTFVSTANAFVLRGGIPVFVDIRPDTFNIDEKLIEDAITSKTRAIVPVHYAGVACEMDAILDIANRNNLLVIEDAAQGFSSNYKGKPLGTIGHFGAYSFHETKNIISGEGGALLINAKQFIERAEIIREKGTNRNKFFRGEVDKYTWVDIGSSFLPSELIAAFLFAQLENSTKITESRLHLWNLYHKSLEELDIKKKLIRPRIPENCTHNAHMYEIILNSPEQRTGLLAFLKSKDINAVFHYVPLHSSPAGVRFGRAHGEMANTDYFSERLVRLPLWCGMSEENVKFISEVVADYLLNERS